MAYMPSAREISVKMNRLAGPVTGRWYDPTSGTYRMIAGSPWRTRGFGSSPAGQEQRRRRRLGARAEPAAGSIRGFGLQSMMSRGRGLFSIETGEARCMVANNARFPVPARMCVAPSMDAASPTVATGQPCRATTFAEWRTKAFPRTIWIVRVPLTAGHEKNPGLWISLRLDGGRFRFSGWPTRNGIYGLTVPQPLRVVGRSDLGIAQ